MQVSDLTASRYAVLGYHYVKVLLSNIPDCRVDTMRSCDPSDNYSPHPLGAQQQLESRVGQRARAVLGHHRLTIMRPQPADEFRPPSARNTALIDPAIGRRKTHTRGGQRVVLRPYVNDHQPRLSGRRKYLPDNRQGCLDWAEILTGSPDGSSGSQKSFCKSTNTKAVCGGATRSARPAGSDAALVPVNQDLLLSAKSLHALIIASDSTIGP